MLEEKTYQGYWWTDENPDRKVPGDLKYEPNGRIELKILAPLNTDMQTFGPETIVEYDRIYGLTEDDDYVTLLNCTRDKVQLSIGNQGVQTAKYVISRFVEGDAFTNNQDIKFSNVSFEYPLLDQWANITGVNMEIGSDNENDDNPLSMDAGDTFNITYEVQDRIGATADEYTISLTIRTTTNPSRVGGISIDESTKIRVEKEDGMISLEEVFELNKKLQDFVTFAVRKSTFPSNITATIPTNGPGNNSVNIIFDQVSEIDSPERLRTPNFVLDDIHDTFERTLSTWFDLYSQLEPVFNVYFGTKYNKTMYLNNQFLGFTQALETYHRRSDYTDTYLDDDEFGDYKEELINTVHDDYDQSFRDHMVDGVFKHANEYSLRKRLNGLVDAHENVLNELPWNVDSEVNPITNTRNYLTHYDDDIDEEMDRLYEFNLILEALLEACLLTDLEIPEDHITQRLGSRYSELTRGMDLPNQVE